METERPVLRSRVWLIAVCTLAALLLGLATIGAGTHETTVAILVTAVLTSLIVVVWATIVFRAQRREHEEHLTAWAAERAVHTERLRIARELHDLASHGIGLITVRAASCRSLPECVCGCERESALHDIEITGRQTMMELRRMIGVLRTAESESAPLQPPTSFADLPHIIATAREGGVSVALETRRLEGVSPGVQLTACAIVREGLVNAARHAGATTARVVVAGGAGHVRVSVEDDGPAGNWTPHPGAGYGLAGLRERARTLGGTVTAEPHGTGWRLEATLPDSEQT